MTTPTIDWINAAGSESDDRERRICEVAADLDRSQALAAADRELIATLARWVRQKSKGIGEDWACAQCRPDSGILVDGFVCAVHLAQRIPPNEKELRAIASGAKPTHLPCPDGRHARARTDVATGITTCLDCGEGWS